MANKGKSSTKQPANNKNDNILLIVAAAAVVLCLGVVLLVPQGGKPAAESGSAQEIQPGESLVIPQGDVTSTAAFYPITVDGTRMEVIAVRDSQGAIRTAFNTCQVCYNSGRGYYVQEGNALVCQNCGNRFSVDQVEIEAGGCNPWPIFPENKTVTEDAILISYDYLSAATRIFANWKS